MKSNHLAYDHLASVERIDEILTTSDNAYDEVKSIPSRDRLTFTNGFYVWCSALFVDVRGSSDLPTKYKRPTLARIYRSYISEAVAVLNGNSDCAEIMIVGDAVSAVFDTPYKEDINGVFDTVARLNSVVKLLNCRLWKRKLEPIRVGIGISYGRALMIKAGNKGSTINEVVWMGEVVNRAAKLCSLGGRTAFDPNVIVDALFADNLIKEYQAFLRNSYQGHYTCDVVDLAMEDWYDKNCR